MIQSTVATVKANAERSALLESQEKRTPMRERILQLLRQQPFQPFRLHLTNGMVHVIRHPDHLMVAQTYLVVGVPVSDTATHEVSEVINRSLLHVVAVEPFIAATPPAAN